MMRHSNSLLFGQKHSSGLAHLQRYRWWQRMHVYGRSLFIALRWHTLLPSQSRRKRKIMLVIDDWLLRPDDSTLGRANDQYLQQLQQMGWCVLLLLCRTHWYTSTEVKNSTYWAEPYADVLYKRGIPVLAGGFFRFWRKAWLLRNAAALDCVLFRWPDAAVAYLPFFRQHSAAKLLFLAMDLQAERKRREYAVTQNPVAWAEGQRLAKMEAEIFQTVDGVLTFSHAEDAWLRQQYGEKVFHLPLFLYSSIPAVRRLPPAEQTLLFVGNFAHTPNRDGLTWFLEMCWPMLKQAHERVRLVIIGALADAAIFALKAARIEVLGKVSDTQLTQLYQQARVVIAPLRFGAGVKGKVIEALAHGVPVVTTRFGIEGVPGLEAIIPPTDTPQAMSASIARLLTDDKEWQRVSVSGQAFVQQYFSPQAAEQSLNKLFAWLGANK